MCLQLSGAAQDPVYRNIDKSTGLPSNTIYDIFQDAKGFIWIGHEKGLSKYDGFRFTHYQNEEQRGRPLSNLLEDSTGKIWSQNFVGQFFYVDNDTLKLCRQLTPTGSYSPAGLIGGNTLIASGKNAIRYLNTQTMVVKERLTDVFSSNHHPYANSEKYFFLNKDSGKIIITNEEGITEVKDAPFRLDYFYIIPTRSGIYYLPKYPNENLDLINWNTQEISHLFPPKTFVQNIRIIDNSLIAVMTSNGFYLFNDNFKPFDKNHPHFFKNKNISTIARDREGNWWVGTLNEGILLVPNMSTTRMFEALSLTSIQANTRDQALFLGTANNQLLSYSLKTRSLKTLFDNKLNQEVVTIFYDSVSEDIAFASNKLFIHPKGKPPITHEGAIKDIQKLDDQHYIAAASGFVSILSREIYSPKSLWQKTYTQLGLTEGDDPTNFRLSKDEIRARALAITPDVIYAATTNGLIAYTLHGQEEILYNKKSLIASDLQCYNNTIYAVSFNDGLLKVENGQLKKIYSPEKKSVAGIYKLKIVKDIAWMLTETNLIAYHLKEEKIRFIDQTSGLPMDDLRDFSVMNDTVYMVGNKGLIYFPVTLSRSDQIAPGLIINSFMVNQRRKDLTKKISLTSGENDIVINYSVIAYKAGNDLQVAYSINNSEWRSLENSNRELRLASLAPGNYTIGLKAASNDGLAAKEVQLSFDIRKPFYLEVWFVTLCVLILIIFTYQLYMQRLAKIRYQSKLETDRLQLEQALQQSLLASIKAQMNPHFIYNSLSSIHAFVYSDDKENAIKYLDRFSELTRKVLELSGHESILLSEEKELLETYISLEKMRFGESFQSTIICDKDIDVHFVRLPSMIIQPFVENAIKHGLLHRKGNKQLLISFSRKKDDLIVVIEDNGVGRKTSAELKSNKNKQHTSFSISANRKRLELLNAKKKNTIGLQIVDKTDEMGRGSGTTVIITIPTQFS
ncbi:MAG: hypothetical protein EBR30_17720 [Cytophagia bacterium]|nr:hypothetical protein [Cytophagia bacterium]NBW36824.1 hypothetical protein [Cytophagia bacterium]